MNDRFRFRLPMYNAYDEMFFQFDFFDIYNHPLPFVGGVITKKPEQCTGLKDKNGKLIYEGDIVRIFYDHFNGTFTEKEVIGPVTWECGTWVVNNSLLNHAPEYDDIILESSAVEVIGNIHENPELLEAVTNCNQ